MVRGVMFMGFIGFVLAAVPPAVQPATTSTKRLIIVDEMGEYWERRVAAFKKEEASIRKGGIVLLGDSLTEGVDVKKYFPGKNVINRGISGDKIGGWKYYGILDRLDTGVFNLKPRAVFILIGINDIIFWNTPSEEMEKGYNAVFSELKRRAPKTKIYIQSLLPTTSKRYGKYNNEVIAWNKKLRALARKYSFTYLDFAPAFKDKNGKLKKDITKDGLHLNEKGYAIWANLLRKYF